MSTAAELQTYNTPMSILLPTLPMVPSGLCTQYNLPPPSPHRNDVRTPYNVDLQDAINEKYKPSLPADPRSGVGLQEAGCGDFKWLTVRPFDGLIPDTETEQGQLYIGSCAQLALKLRWVYGNNSATNTLIRWYFSDEARSTWGQWSVLNTTAGSGSVIPVVMYFELTSTDYEGIIAIPNPGAQYIKFTIDGQATPADARLSIEVMRGWGQTKVIEV